ncbi:HD domain-containing phosphohydrolase [Deinococcus aquaticus]|uniref:HD domain-containing protein n=1 Tax=Deinococcus aquaticus TaxID=328692 RepID=A0ABY7V5N1_9DEIO|nr:HD domain-containing phosphohydrolase [Deinococcus aquaticus]WDA60390.1 HD domain-containing protein [Deinococcus aquaticus]
MNLAPTDRGADGTVVPDREKDARDLLNLTALALGARDIASGVTPTLEKLVRDTAAGGSAYFQADRRLLAFRVRAATGEMPQTPGMQAVAAHGLPGDTPLMVALQGSASPLFYDDTRLSPDTLGFPELGVASLAAAPVRDAQGQLLGAFLMHTFEAHVWQREEATLFSMISSTIAALAGRLVAEEEVRVTRESALRALGLALEARDGETQGHTDRVTSLAVRFADRLGWTEQQREALRWGAYLHDIGKIAIPDAVLLKPGLLDPEERASMCSHVQAGVRFAHALQFLPPGALSVIQDHHERWDGSGYPRRVAAQAISLQGRLFALCDVYDALTSPRPYKAAWTHERAISEIRTQAGRQFDPALVEPFVELTETVSTGPGQDA